MRKEKPADYSADNVARRERDVDIKGLELSETCRLEENDRITKDGIAAKNLSGPDDAIL